MASNGGRRRAATQADVALQPPGRDEPYPDDDTDDPGDGEAQPSLVRLTLVFHFAGAPDQRISIGDVAADDMPQWVAMVRAPFATVRATQDLVIPIPGTVFVINMEKVTSAELITEGG